MPKSVQASTYTFRNIIEGGFLYVDKTNYLYDLVRPATGIARAERAIPIPVISGGEPEIVEYRHDPVPAGAKRHPLVPDLPELEAGNFITNEGKRTIAGPLTHEIIPQAGIPPVLGTCHRTPRQVTYGAHCGAIAAGVMCATSHWTLNRQEDGGAGAIPLTHRVYAAESRNALGRRFSATKHG